MSNHAALTSEFDRVIEDVRQERHHQIADGWTPEHDDGHATRDMIRLAEQRLHRQGGMDHDSGFLDRHHIVQGIAILVAALEAWDRRETAR